MDNQVEMPFCNHNNGTAETPHPPSPRRAPESITTLTSTQHKIFSYILGAFVWTDNSAVFYANWADNEPNSVEDNEKCTEVWSPDSNWNDVDCKSKRGFICKIKQGKT